MAQRDDPSDATVTAGVTTVSTAVAVVRDDAPPRDDLPGYQVRGELGRGGMGRVLRAEDPRLGREVAVKRLHSNAPGARARFEREARITARLQHPGIVPVHEVGTDADGVPYYAMRLVTGRTLAESLRAAPTLDERLGLLQHVLAVADAIAYAHSRRVIHRDLKASNVVVGEFGETIVIDWGLAKDLASDDDDVPAPAVPVAALPRPAAAGDDRTSAGTVLGTPAYMPPEQAAGDPVDERADVYALGVMLYHLLAGELPYRGRNSNAVLAEVLAGPPPAVAARAPGVPRDLAAIVAKAMARSPDDRYPSAREMAAELHRFQAGQLVAAHAYTRRELAARWLRRHRGAVIVATVALVGAGLGGGLAIERIVDARGRAERERDAAVRARAEAVGRADEAVLARARDLSDEIPRSALEELRELSVGSAQWTAARVVAADAMARGVGRMVGLMGHAGIDLAVGADGTVVAASSAEVLWAPPGSRGMWIAPAAHPALAPDGTAYAWLDGDHAVIGDGTPPADEVAAPLVSPPQVGSATEPAAATPPGQRRVAVPPGTTEVALAPGAAAVFALAAGRVYRIDPASGQRTELGAAPAGGSPASFGRGATGVIWAGALVRRADGTLALRARAWA